MKLCVAALIVVPVCVGFSDRPSFTVASVKPSAESAQGIHLAFSPGGRFTASNVTLRFLIKIAYDLRDDQIGGGPGWLGSKRYDVEGKCDPPLSASGRAMQDEVRLRLQALLEDRFQLKLTESSKDLQGYALVVAKGGSKMHQAGSSARERDDRASDARMEAKSITMAGLAGYLGERTQSVVSDQTGLSGRYAFTLEFAPDLSPDAVPDTSQPSLFTALQQQLGLKLEPHKVPAMFVTVSRAELPSAN